MPFEMRNGKIHLTGIGWVDGLPRGRNRPPRGLVPVSVMATPPGSLRVVYYDRDWRYSLTWSHRTRSWGEWRKRRADVVEMAF
ncbi:hypothetical protein C1280_18035 [Gemmata obscuriglobus]|uniref:Uncharacterized protein n=1 Tax=Gemmata obscuriglobus TaxID=114 RepID=A0A2Z3HBW5_9BACT|nr:hypothetical protein C1280_18035 [Gemmata obscuriglobus]